MKRTSGSALLCALFATVTLGVASPSLAFDADAAKAMFKENDCTKCHAPKKSKKGPSLEKIAAKYKEKDKVATAEATLLKHMNSNPKVKLDDGTEEEHKSPDTKDQAAQKNIIQWILSH